jgi:hypothetical protein
MTSRRTLLRNAIVAQLQAAAKFVAALQPEVS